jgi:hypothetical protein
MLPKEGNDNLNSIPQTWRIQWKPHSPRSFSRKLATPSESTTDKLHLKASGIENAAGF